MKSKICLLTTLASALFALSAPAQQSPPADPATPSFLKISDNGHYFLDRKGHPFFWQGDTEWELFHLFTVADAKTLLKKRHSQGFNVIQVMATGVFPEAFSDRRMKKDKAPDPSTQAWLNNDPLQPNETYFQRVDAIVKAAERYGMVLVIGVYHAKDADAGRITITNAAPWARYLASRYKNAPNIVWAMYPHAKKSSEPIIQATASGLRDGDAAAHLITMHPDPSPTSSSFMHNQPWLGFNTLQTWDTGFTNYQMVKADYDRIPPKVIVDGEARYEGEDRTTAFQARRAGYFACLAGGFYTYGHGNNWLAPRTWKQWWNTPGANQMKIMADLFRSITWWNLIPDQQILLNPAKGTAAARSADGNWLLVYQANPTPITIRMDNLPAAKTVEAYWLNPATGHKQHIGAYPTTVPHTFPIPPGWEDALLLCKSAKK